MRSWGRRSTAQETVSTKFPGLGLVDENGRFAWEEEPGDEGHVFRRYIYEKLRCRTDFRGGDSAST